MYWKMQSRVARRDNKEFDLNDPQAFKKSRPGRVGDNDPCCGVSSLQKFAGEDLQIKQRQRQQQAELMAGIDAQRAANAAKQAQEAAEERAYADHLRRTDEMRARAEWQGMRDKKQQEVQLANEHKMQSRMKRNQEKASKANQDALDQLEIKMALTDKAMLEDRSVFETSALGPGRMRNDHFKGFSAAQRAATYAENARQQEANAARKAAERASTLGYADHMAQVNRAADEQAFHRSVAARQQEQALAHQLKSQARALKARQAADTKRIMGATVGEGFFSSFGKM